MSGKWYGSRRRFVKVTGAVGTTGLVGVSGRVGAQDGTADEIVFYNAGALDADPGTAANLERFEEETGISVNVNEVPWNNLKTSLTTIWRNEDSTVDVWNGPTWWLADFVRSGWLEPIDLSDDHLSNYPDDLVDLVTFDGEVYMAPQFGKWGNFLYDEETVDTPPDTWDEVLELDVEGQSEFGFTWADKDIFMFKQFLYQAGGQLFNEDQEPVFHGEEGEQVMEFIVELRDQDKIPDGLSSMGEGDLNDAFLAGQFATVEGWTPLGAAALEHEDWGEERLGSALPPEGPESRATFQDTNGIGISAYSENEDAALEFAEFMTTPESAKTDLIVEGNPAVVPEVYEDEEVQEAYPSEFLEHMRFNLENAQSETYIAQPQVDDYLSNEITAVLTDDKDPQQALEDAHDNIQRLYEDIGVQGAGVL